MQYDAPSAHLPDLHRLEQHSLELPHVLPAVLHEVLSGTQLPVVQVPLQQAAPLWQG